jgi:hypothetical protein
MTPLLRPLPAQLPVTRELHSGFLLKSLQHNSSSSTEATRPNGLSDHGVLE